MPEECRDCVYWNRLFDYCGYRHVYHILMDAESFCTHHMTVEEYEEGRI